MLPIYSTRVYRKRTTFTTPFCNRTRVRKEHYFERVSEFKHDLSPPIYFVVADISQNRSRVHVLAIKFRSPRPCFKYVYNITVAIYLALTKFEIYYRRNMFNARKNRKYYPSIARSVAIEVSNLWRKSTRDLNQDENKKSNCLVLLISKKISNEFETFYPNKCSHVIITSYASKVGYFFENYSKDIRSSK